MELSVVKKDKIAYPLQKEWNPLTQERELISKIRLGIFEKTLSSLEDLIDKIIKMEKDNLSAIKVKVMELMFILSRAVVDGGAEYDKISKINCEFAINLGVLEDIDEISVVAHQTLQAYMQSKPVRGLKGNRIVKEVKEYILKNYSKQLTLEEIAKAVHISPFYLSHLYKEVEGLSVIDYLTKVRIENAKLLLRNSDYSINEVSERLGYNDSSYFTKVFKRKEGRTPSQFRKLG